MTVPMPKEPEIQTPRDIENKITHWVEHEDYLWRAGANLGAELIRREATLEETQAAWAHFYAELHFSGYEMRGMGSDHEEAA